MNDRIPPDIDPTIEVPPRPRPTDKPAKGEQVILINAADIEPEQVNWLWRNGLQCGAFNLLAGQSTAGKSTIALSFAATVTSGGQWPDGQAAANRAASSSGAARTASRTRSCRAFWRRAASGPTCTSSKACATADGSGPSIQPPTCRS